MTSLLQTNEKESPYSRLFYCTSILLLLVIAYGWSIFEPLSADALMHVIDANRIKSGHDALMRILGFNLDRDGAFRLDQFYRPVFNDFYISLLKSLFGVSPVYYRLSTLVVQGLSALISFKLFKQLRATDLAAFLGATTLALSPALFFGIYEFGISFSQLLIFSAVTSLYCAAKYARADNKKAKLRNGTFTLLSAFFVVFTKESAALWPMVVIALIYFGHLSQSEVKEQNVASTRTQLDLFFTRSATILRKNFYLFLSLALITVVYFSLRYWKFGSLTAVAMGIEGAIDPFDSVKKLAGYILFAIGIPTGILQPYFSAPITGFSYFEIAIRTALATIFVFCAYRLYGKNKYILAFSLVSALFAFLPIIKVTRNAPYYGDLMSISFAFLIAFGFSAIGKKEHNWLRAALASVLVICLVVQSAYMTHRYVFDSQMWLARAQGYSRAAVADFTSISGVPDSAKIVQIGNVGKTEVVWSTHFGALGSTYFANLGVPLTRFVLGNSTPPSFEDALFIEFRDDIGYRKIGNGIFPGYGRLESAYFSGKLVKKDINDENGIYDVRSEKVLRLRCDRAPIELKPLPIVFTKSNGQASRRLLESTFNLSQDSKDFVAEIIVPPGANTLFFEDTAGCAHPLVEGYKSYAPSVDDFKTSVSNDPSFERPNAWSGKMERSPNGGVVVGPGPGAPNVLFQVLPVSQGVTYLVKAEARLDTGIAQGRLQVNWHAANDSYLESSILVIQPTKDAKIFNLLAKAPANAAKAVLYVTPHGDHDTVVYKSISLMQE